MTGPAASTPGGPPAVRNRRFTVIPAIDIRGGRCVRLLQGDYDRETTYSADPIGMALKWQEVGAPMLHVVDLDGAKAGRPANADLIAAICASVQVPVEVSGGMRSLANVREAIKRGATRVQLGSAAIHDPALVEAACREHGDAIVVSIDARDGQVMTDGWTAGSGVNAIDLARRMVEAGVPRLMYTDIGRDGGLQGPNLDALREIVEAVPVPVIASGGITTIDQLESVIATGAEGAIIGKALYEGQLDLREALVAARGQSPHPRNSGREPLGPRTPDPGPS
jgi:phosphoribosylformimino-5-aminoimidazole carboxamide ribotide isomerase